MWPYDYDSFLGCSQRTLEAFGYEDLYEDVVYDVSDEELAEEIDIPDVSSEVGEDVLNDSFDVSYTQEHLMDSVVDHLLCDSPVAAALNALLLYDSPEAVIRMEKQVEKYAEETCDKMIVDGDDFDRMMEAIVKFVLDE
ncbi:unnamed protein product [Caenorhabditis sp. 36 PRJEB53466]|nr:unnamed protein product [Caenorhabditis sp. 36 PRJEB53466]